MAKKGSNFTKYSLEFKLWLVEKYLAGEGGVETLALSNGLKSKTQLKDWIKKYRQGELTETAVDKRGSGSAGGLCVLLREKDGMFRKNDRKIGKNAV